MSAEFCRGDKLLIISKGKKCRYINYIINDLCSVLVVSKRTGIERVMNVKQSDLVLVSALKLQHEDIASGLRVVVKCDTHHKYAILNKLTGVVDRPYFLNGEVLGVVVKMDVSGVCQIIPSKYLRRAVCQEK